MVVPVCLDGLGCTCLALKALHFRVRYIHVGGLQYTTYDWTLKIGGISNGYQGSESGLHPGDPELGTREMGMAGRIRRGDIIHEVRRM